jgi:hypothetical protein
MADRRTHETKKHPDHRSSDENWIKSHWRPMMAWQYFVICMFDFLVAPIFFAWFSWFTKTNMTQWQPLTLQGGGLYHLAMGAIIGISSYAKTQERVAYSNNQTSSYGSGGYGNSMGGYQSPNSFQQAGSFNQSNQFSSQTTSFQGDDTSKPALSKGPKRPKPAPIPADDPEL